MEKATRVAAAFVRPEPPGPWARRGGGCGARASPWALPSGRSRARPSGLLLRRRLRLRLPLLKEDAAQPNSSLIIPAQISLRRKHSLSSRTPSAALSLTRLGRIAVSVAFRYPEPQVEPAPGPHCRDGRSGGHGLAGRSSDALQPPHAPLSPFVCETPALPGGEEL